MQGMYNGAPDECSYHFAQGEIIKLIDGECPKCEVTNDGYSFCQACQETHHWSYIYCKRRQ